MCGRAIWRECVNAEMFEARDEFLTCVRLCCNEKNHTPEATIMIMCFVCVSVCVHVCATHITWLHWIIQNSETFIIILIEL